MADAPWQFASWNLCGVRKLARHQGILAWLLSLQVIFIQESLQVTCSFQFPGFARFDVPAVETRIRASGGLITLINKSWLGNGTITELCASSYLLVHRVAWGGAGVLLGNVYAPIHSEGCPMDILAIIRDEFESISSLYPSDSIILG